MNNSRVGYTYQDTGYHCITTVQYLGLYSPMTLPVHMEVYKTCPHFCTIYKLPSLFSVAILPYPTHRRPQDWCQAVPEAIGNRLFERWYSEYKIYCVHVVVVDLVDQFLLSSYNSANSVWWVRNKLLIH